MAREFTPPPPRVGPVLQYLRDRPTPLGEIIKQTKNKISSALYPLSYHILTALGMDFRVRGVFLGLSGHSTPQVVHGSMWFSGLGSSGSALLEM